MNRVPRDITSKPPSPPELIRWVREEGTLVERSPSLPEITFDVDGIPNTIGPLEVVRYRLARVGLSREQWLSIIRWYYDEEFKLPFPDTIEILSDESIENLARQLIRGEEKESE